MYWNFVAIDGVIKNQLINRKYTRMDKNFVSLKIGEMSQQE
jgi:hypothetical protein